MTNIFTRELLIAGFSFGFFVVCPRMAGMMNVINRHSSVPMAVTVIFGVIISVPILLLMVFVFSKFGTGGALAVCILTDLAAAFIMKDISYKAGLETFIVALFVIAGVKTAPLLSNMIIK